MTNDEIAATLAEAKRLGKNQAVLQAAIKTTADRRVALVQQLVLAGVPQVEIARQLGIQPSIISRLLARTGTKRVWTIETEER